MILNLANSSFYPTLRRSRRQPDVLLYFLTIVIILDTVHYSIDYYFDKLWFSWIQIHIGWMYNFYFLSLTSTTETLGNLFLRCLTYQISGKNPTRVTDLGIHGWGLHLRNRVHHQQTNLILIYSSRHLERSFLIPLFAKDFPYSTSTLK